MKYLLFLISMIYLSGCDYAYGPSIHNSISPSIVVQRVYLDKTTNQFIMKPSDPSTFLGRGDEKKDTIVRLRIIKDGKTMYDLNASTIKKMIKIQDETKYPSDWVIDKKGIYLRYYEYKSGIVSIKELNPSEKKRLNKIFGDEIKGTPLRI